MARYDHENSGSDLIEIGLKFCFFPKTGRSVAVSDDDQEISFPPKPVVFLPLSEVEIYPPYPEPGDLVTVTMPQWLAEDKGFV